jgi:hypothetical protein
VEEWDQGVPLVTTVTEAKREIFDVFLGVREVRDEFENTEDHSNDKATKEPGWVS